jgi:hypothetical protein
LHGHLGITHAEGGAGFAQQVSGRQRGGCLSLLGEAGRGQRDDRKGFEKTVHDAMFASPGFSRMTA